jgi:triphosphoribosyl-dephospho-CoA synthase
VCPSLTVSLPPATNTTPWAKACFVRACELDVAVRKPGNVSVTSAGHGMRSEMFVASAHAAADALFRRGARVGDRIEAAVAASWGAAGCNTNLGIVLLCAPVALAAEQQPDATSPATLRAAIETVLAALDPTDARAAFRAITAARPAGLGTAPEQDVRHPPTVDLRAAMTLAAGRDLVARQYRDGYADLFGLGLSSLGPGFSLMATPTAGQAQAATADAVQRLYLELLSGFADSHIVRKHGEAVAHIVMTVAHAWRERARRGGGLDAEAEFAAWDVALKADRINPGTTADLTVATLMIAGLTRPT